MSKDVRGLLVGLTVSSFISFSFIEKDASTVGLSVGDIAPSVALARGNVKSLIEDTHSDYVLVNFWGSYDAASRIQNKELFSVVDEAENVEMVSISFDDFESIYKETIRKDQLPAEKCSVELAGCESEVFKTYRLEKGFRNYLLDNRGVIVAKNLSPETLATYLNRN